MTAALDALYRLDTGTDRPGDATLAARLETACQQAAYTAPLWCAHGVNVAVHDCNGCFLDWDQAMRRTEDD